jgi:hypothetical protein
MDKDRRDFLKLSLKLISAGAITSSIYPFVSLYQEKIIPIAKENFTGLDIPENIDFSRINSIIPQLLVISSIMTFIMMYADSLQSILLILASTFALIIIGVPITEWTLGLFVNK